MKSKYSPLRTPEERRAFWYNELGERRCSGCQSFKDVEQFSNDKRGIDGKTFWCKACVAAKHKKYYSENPDKYQAKKALDNRLYYQRQYGITKVDKEKMLAEQANVCAICLKSHARMHVDHCHATGKIRGILCTNCNRGIGHLQEEIYILQNAIKYLETHSEDVEIAREGSCQ